MGYPVLNLYNLVEFADTLLNGAHDFESTPNHGLAQDTLRNPSRYF